MIKSLSWSLCAAAGNALEEARHEEEGRRCIGMAVTPREKHILELMRDDYFIAVGKVYRAALDAIKQ